MGLIFGPWKGSVRHRGGVVQRNAVRKTLQLGKDLRGALGLPLAEDAGPQVVEDEESKAQAAKSA